MKTKAETDKLIQDHKKLIDAEVRKYAQFVPETFVLVEAYKIAANAAKKWEPTQGQFSTLLINEFKQLSRLSTQYGNSVRLPEAKQFKINRLNHIEEDLKGKLGRTPSASEIADKAEMSLAEVNNLLNNRKKEVTLNNLVSTNIFSDNDNRDDWTHFVYHDLPDRDKIIFEHKTGFAGKAILNNEEIAKKLKISPSTVQQRIGLFTNKLKEGW